MVPQRRELPITAPVAAVVRCKHIVELRGLQLTFSLSWRELASRGESYGFGVRAKDVCVRVIGEDS